jgi:hypothetical protein
VSADNRAADHPAGASYPPEPWQLGGSMFVSVFRVPPADLPRDLDLALPIGTRPLLLGGQAVVGAAFVRYEPGSVLSYDELLTAVLVHRRGRLRTTIPDIWVDSPASVAGGRELWGIPKVLADFERTTLTRGGAELRATAGGQVVAELRVRPRWRLPGWRRLPLSTAQRLDGVETVSRVQSLARVRVVQAAWRFPVGSPLRYLDGRRPVVSTALEQMAISFGSAGPPARAS